MFFGVFGDDFEITKEELVIGSANSVVLDRNGAEIANLSKEQQRKIISLDEMADYLPKAYVAIEDKRFYDHDGVDWKRTLGAIGNTILKGGSSYGGSSITQQLVKNITGDKDSSGIAGIMRKVKEWTKAYQVERMISKQQILELYLNILFIGGQDIHGVELGAQYYFSKSAKDLDLAQCAFLAGINSSPNSYNPFDETKDQEKVKETIKKKVLTVLKEMKDQGYIENEEEYNKAVAEAEAGLVFTKGNVENTTDYSYHTDAALKQIINQVMKEKNVTREFAEKYVEVEEGSDLTLEVLFNPSDSVNKTLHFASADEEVATVTDDGVVHGVTVGGPVVVTCWAEDIGKQDPIQCYVTVVEKKVPATDFAVSPTNKTVTVGGSFQINAIFTPENATDKSVKYESGNSSVAKVDAKGKVTGVKTGVTAIVCTAVESGITRTCTVTVVPAVKLRLSPVSKNIAKGHSFTIRKIVAPSNASTASNWRSSNSKIATVNANGKVTGKKYGSCTITCTLVQSGVKATCRVKVSKLKTKIKLNKTNIRIGVGQSYRLKKTITTNGTKAPSVKWRSSNKRVVSVSSGGKVKGKRIGAAKVTVTTKGKIKAKATCRVTVIRRVTSITMTKQYATCFVGHSIKLNVSIRPKKASIKKLKWRSSDNSIATVTGSGKVTGLKAGEVTITAHTKDGSNKKTVCHVKVMEEIPVSSIVVAQSSLTMKRGDKAKLAYSVLPNNTSDSLKFASDNKRVAKVNSNGVVTAVGTGNATITIMSSGGVSSTVSVNVVAMNKSSLSMRQYDTETLTVFGTSDTVTWYSSNARVASVANGVVTGRGKGTTYIYAYVNGCKVACKVTIVSVNK